jgi:hypothetical protein
MFATPEQCVAEPSQAESLSGDFARGGLACGWVMGEKLASANPRYSVAHSRQI